jgi:muramoyltetrapeptide carboxypeptidase LdcA involved in peptidoglycan recycling
LDEGIVRANPKPFFGYSDNTNVLNWLWNLGIVSYHGGSTMVHLARPGGVHPVSLASLEYALFSTGAFEIKPVQEFSDINTDWSAPGALDLEMPTTAESGWHWHNAVRSVTGRTWGGNLEILHWNLAAGRWIRPVDDYAGSVLLIETSEEMPPAEEVFRMLRNMGERQLLAQFPAVVIAKPKAWNFEHRLDESARAAFREDQRDAVLRALACYNPDAVAVFGPDFGHTDPQSVLPYGGLMTVNGPGKQLSVAF